MLLFNQITHKLERCTQGSFGVCVSMHQLQQYWKPTHNGPVFLDASPHLETGVASAD